ncbi:MAG: hypothetical protein KDA84_15680, partial [Planctomycetaceae bacterium]|nr:hypothetical protein [Planctomycetaceae bacterium]
FCEQRQIEILELRGYGLDGFVWQTSEDSMVKVFRHENDFQRELEAYRRLESHQVDQLQGFFVPLLLHYDENLFVLELSYVRPPYILDFAAATLDQVPPGFDPEDPTWIAEKQRVFGVHWAEVARLLDALRHLGIYYPDVHAENIRIGP